MSTLLIKGVNCSMMDAGDCPSAGKKGNEVTPGTGKTGSVYETAIIDYDNFERSPHPRQHRVDFSDDPFQTVFLVKGHDDGRYAWPFSFLLRPYPKTPI